MCAGMVKAAEIASSNRKLYANSFSTCISRLWDSSGFLVSYQLRSTKIYAISVDIICLLKSNFILLKVKEKENNKKTKQKKNGS